jgi:hypothetical protein
MSKTLTAFIGLVITLLALPGDALAWGPGVHLAMGGTILENLGLVSPFIADILARHRDLFLYGCISADIFIGKGSRIHDGHSHNWDTGFALLHSARDPGLRAYAYGYLSHLAADTVAHNYYVPNILAAAPSAASSATSTSKCRPTAPSTGIPAERGGCSPARPAPPTAFSWRPCTRTACHFSSGNRFS